MESKKACKCCGNVCLSPDSLFQVCPICGWESDPLQEAKPNLAGGANELSLNEYRDQYSELKKQLKANGTIMLRLMHELALSREGRDRVIDCIADPGLSDKELLIITDKLVVLLAESRTELELIDKLNTSPINLNDARSML